VRYQQFFAYWVSCSGSIQKGKDPWLETHPLQLLSRGCNTILRGRYWVILLQTWGWTGGLPNLVHEMMNLGISYWVSAFHTEI
jgi:hypothetical protein